MHDHSDTSAPHRASIATVLLLALLLVPAPPARGQLIDSRWEGGEGNWSVAVAWAPDSVPDNDGSVLYNVHIDGGEGGVSSIVHCDLSVTIERLFVDAADVLVVETPNSIRFTPAALIDNAGEIRLNQIWLDGETQLRGGGLVSFDDTPLNQLSSSLFLDAHLDNVDNRIEGEGVIGVSLANGVDGVVDANRADRLLVVQPDSGGVANDGTMCSSAGGTLVLRSSCASNRFDNGPGGLIEARSGSTVRMDASCSGDGPHLRGGAVRTSGNGVVELAGGSSGVTFEDLALDGDIRGVQSGKLTLVGSVANAGTLLLEAAAFVNRTLIVDGPVELSGGGELVVKDHASYRLRVRGAGGANDHLLNTGHTIRGSGLFGDDQIALTNEGAIVADDTRALVIDANSAGFLNAGSLASTGIGGMVIGDGPFVSSGIVTIAEGSTITRTGDWVQTAGATIVDGDLDPTGSVDLQGGSLEGTGRVLAPVQCAGTVRPGTSPGRLAILGPYAQSAAGRLAIDVHGLEPATGHDVLEVSGSASLDGELALAFAAPYEPASGDTLRVLVAASVTGAFAGTVVTGLPPVLAASVSVDPFGVLVTLEPATAVSGASGGSDGLKLCPNPAPGGRAVVRYATRPSVDAIALDILDVSGRRVRALPVAPGPGAVPWDGRDAAGSPVSAGIYLVRLATRDGVRVKRLTVVR